MRTLIVLALLGFVALAVGQNVDDTAHEAATLDLAPEEAQAIENNDVTVAEETGNEVSDDNTAAVKIPKRFRRPIFGAGKKTLRRQLTRDAIKGRGRKLTKEIREAMKLKKNKAATLDLASEDAQAVENADVPVAEETGNEVSGDNTDAVKVPKRFRRPTFGAGKKSKSSRRQLTRDAIKGRGRKASKESVKKILEAMKLKNLKNIKNVKTTEN